MGCSRSLTGSDSPADARYWREARSAELDVAVFRQSRPRTRVAPDSSRTTRPRRPGVANSTALRRWGCDVDGRATFRGRTEAQKLPLVRVRQRSALAADRPGQQ